MPTGVYERTKSHLENMRLSRLGKELTDEHKKKIALANSDDKSVCWKGNKVSYSGLHKWINKKILKKYCNFCRTNTRKLTIANKSGKYLRDLSDWMVLCVPCHKIYDLKRKYAKTYPRCWAK